LSNKALYVDDAIFEKKRSFWSIENSSFSKFRSSLELRNSSLAIFLSDTNKFS
jgi:hypothetical protein